MQKIPVFLHGLRTPAYYHVRRSSSTSCGHHNHSAVIIDSSALRNYPSHILAVYAQTQSGAERRKRKITFFPTCHPILVAHCSKLPILASTGAAVEVDQSGNVMVPIVPLCIPSAETFSFIQDYIYSPRTRRVHTLLSSLLPAFPSLPETISLASRIQHFARHFAEQCSEDELISSSRIIHAVLRNMSALRMVDEDMWSAVEFAWECIKGAIQCRNMSG